jgi:hypothetical protein
MTRPLGLSCYLVLLAVTTVRVVAQQPAHESKPVTLTATIEAIDKANRVVTVKGPKGNSIAVKAPDQMEGFDSLKVGDEVSATYFEAVAVQVRKPGEPAPSADPTTTVRRKDRTPGSETRREQTFTVSIEAIDMKAPSVRVKGPEGRVLTLAVRDPTRLQSLKVGDTVDVTYYDSLLVKVVHAPKKKMSEGRVRYGSSG